MCLDNILMHDYLIYKSFLSVRNMVSYYFQLFTINYDFQFHVDDQIIYHTSKLDPY